jgi:hypothetical protein
VIAERARGAREAFFVRAGLGRGGMSYLPGMMTGVEQVMSACGARVPAWPGAAG